MPLSYGINLTRKGKIMIRCWFFRRAISRTLDDAQTPSADLEGHLLACTDCRAFYKSEAVVVERLGQDVPAQQEEPSAFLHRKVMARIDRERLGSAALPVSRLPVWSTSVAAALALAIGFFTLSLKYGGHQAKETASKAPVTGVHRSAHDGLELPSRFPELASIRSWTARLDQTLETELQAMLQDAQSAIHLLAHNFLPENVAP